RAFGLEHGTYPAVRRVAWYANAAPLRSGWALGQDELNPLAAAMDAPLGRGRVIVFGPEITHRAQSHGTFKFLFNAILYPRAERRAGLYPRRSDGAGQPSSSLSHQGVSTR